MTTTQEQTLPELVNELGITLEIRHRSHPNKVSEWQEKANCYRVTLRYQGRSYSLNYYQGRGIEREPGVVDVVHCLASDRNILSSCDTLKCFAGCFGWNEDTANTYRAIKRQSARYNKLIGNTTTLELIGSKEY